MFSRSRKLCLSQNTTYTRVFNSHNLRHLFTEWTRQQLTIDPNYNRKIIINNEAHFWKLWSLERNQSTLDSRAFNAHKKKITVCCRFRSNNVISRYFFENEVWTSSNFFLPELDDLYTNIGHSAWPSHVEMIWTGYGNVARSCGMFLTHRLTTKYSDLQSQRNPYSLTIAQFEIATKIQYNNFE